MEAYVRARNTAPDSENRIHGAVAGTIAGVKVVLGDEKARLRDAAKSNQHAIPARSRSPVMGDQLARLRHSCSTAFRASKRPGAAARESRGTVVRSELAPKLPIQVREEPHRTEDCRALGPLHRRVRNRSLPCLVDASPLRTLAFLGQEARRTAKG